MADVKWIKITTDIFDDEKVLLIESLPSADSIIVIWFKLLTFAGKQNNAGVFIMMGRIPYTEEMLASVFRRDISTIRLALETFQQFGMIEVIGDVITIPNWNKYQTLDAYEKKKERDKQYQQQRRMQQKVIAGHHFNASLCKSPDASSDTSPDCHVDESLCVAVSKEDKDIDKEKEYKNTMCMADANALFEHLWKLYPSKKGKGQVSDAKKKNLYKIGREEMERAIRRYVADLEKESWRKPQNGSTFFNSGYVDYLDSNYGVVKNTMPAVEEMPPEEELVGDDW